MKPYYEHGGVTIYHGDCREVLPALPGFDLALTDPPYGIARVWQGGFNPRNGWGKAGKDAADRNAWDDEAPDAETLRLIMSKARESVFWGGNYFDLPPSRGWLVWTKPERGFSLSEAELAWTSRDTVIRVFDGPRSDPGREHPTQKPLFLMTWCLGQFPKAATVVDPYMGSGTTLVAAKALGRKAVGIERSEQWCEAAARRLSQEVLAL